MRTHITLHKRGGAKVKSGKSLLRLKIIFSLTYFHPFIN